MGESMYIGARYVPQFADPEEWNNTRTYDPLTVVLHNGDSYTSKQAVPVGIDITNSEFWAHTGNYNAQVEQYRQEVLGFDERINSLEKSKDGIKSYNALELGFKNDGVTNNTPVLTSILNDKPINESMEIIFPVGVYAFSPIEIETNNLILKGCGNAFSHRTRFESTVFVPIANQSYIITLGSNSTDYSFSTQFTGNEINNIQFCTNKPNTTNRQGVDNNFKVNRALIISRQYMTKIYDVAFYYCYGAGLEIKSSWENFFSNLMFRFIFAPEKAALVFGTDFMNYVEGVISDCSSNIFENIELEQIAGNYITFENDCNVENNVFNSIIIEVGRTDDSWGAIWTSNTIYPSGVTQPDHELAIFNFEDGALYRNNAINSIVISFIAARSYTWNGDVYLHNSIVKCENAVKDFDFQIANLNTMLNRTFVYLLNNNNNDFNHRFVFSVANAIIANYTYRVKGYAEHFNTNITAPYKVNYIYDEANSTCNYINEIITNNKHAPLIKGVDDCYSKNLVCAVIPNSTIFNENKTTVKIPILGNTLHMRIHQNNQDELIYIIRNFAAEQLAIGNFANAPAGWSWVTVDTSQYDVGFISILNRANKQENYIDVFYYD